MSIGAASIGGSGSVGVAVDVQVDVSKAQAAAQEIADVAMGKVASAMDKGMSTIATLKSMVG